ncbi:CatA-like O-acetyltransferase [Myroides sp. LJL110]
MKKLIDIQNWDREQHYLFFKEFDEPFFGITAKIDCTIAYERAKEKGVSFFLYYLYKALQVANNIENFRYRILDNKVYLFDQIHASPTILRPNKTFGFAYMNYTNSSQEFYIAARKEIQRVEQSKDLLPHTHSDAIIHFSSIPWINFSSISHARNFDKTDSSPKISFGKMIQIQQTKQICVSLHLHHALGDGYHAGLFFEEFQKAMDN